MRISCSTISGRNGAVETSQEIGLPWQSWLRSLLCRSGYALLLVLVSGCRAQDTDSSLPMAVFSGNTMGSTYTVKVVASRPITQEEKVAIANAIEKVLADIDVRLSTYRDDSELSRFNAQRELAPFPFSKESLEVLALSQKISQETNGAFDITVSPLVELWGFGRKRKAENDSRVPTPEDIAAAKMKVGYDKISIDLAAGTAQKSNPDVVCDVGAIAPGYASDKVAEAINQLGFENYMVEIGGEVRARGHNPEGNLWRIGIEKPDPEGRTVQRVVSLDDAALSTSGDYRNYFEKDGKRYCHEIDPRTGRPIEHNLASVSVIAPDCASADAYATALMVLGHEEGKAFAEKHNLPAYFILHNKDGNFEEDESSAFTQYMERVGKLPEEKTSAKSQSP